MILQLIIPPSDSIFVSSNISKLKIMKYLVRPILGRTRRLGCSPLSSDTGWLFLKGNLHSEGQIVCTSLTGIKSVLLCFCQNWTILKTVCSPSNTTQHYWVLFSQVCRWIAWVSLNSLQDLQYEQPNWTKVSSLCLC